MSKAPSILLAALLVAALAAPASVGGVSLLDANTASTAPSVGVSENTTRVLRLEQLQAAGFGAPDVVVLDATAAQAAELDTAYSLNVVERKLSAAPNATVRREILRNYTEAAQQDVSRLVEAEQEAREAYAEGDITARQYAQELAVIHARAAALQRFLGSTSSPQPSMWSFTSPYQDIQDRVDVLREDLQHLTGPVRAEMAAAVRGDRAPLRVFVAAGQNGFELSYIRADGVYVRSAYRADNIDDDPTGARSIESILRIAPNLYPWALAENASGPGSLAATPVPAHGSIRTTIQHPHGRVLAQVDASTEQVYYEVQYKRLEALPVDYTYDRTENGSRLLVSRTYPGGPLKVRLLNVSGTNTTGYTDTPVNVNGTVHRTDADGVAWFISPEGAYNVTTVANQTEFHVNVTA